MNNIQHHYRLAKDLNDLSIKDIADITGVPYKTAESHLYDAGRGPGWREAYLVTTALNNAGMRIPRELKRATDRDMARMYRWVRRHRTGCAREMVGDVVLPRKMYVFNGVTSTISDIAKTIGESYYFVYSRIINSRKNSGDDVTDCVTRPKRKRR